MIRAILIDDEPAATELLATLINNFIPDVEVLAEVHSVKEGITKIRDLEPDLVFLDIQMPQGGGFALLRSFEDLNFSVIFTTAYDQYAIKAIQHSALDYILKPITSDRLQEAVSRYRKLVTKRSLQESSIYLLPDNLMNLHQQSTKVVIPIPKGMKIVTVAEIVYLKASGVYAEIVLSDGTVQVVSKGLKHFESVLKGFGMLRVHDSYIINLQHLDRYIRGRGGEVFMKNGSEIPVSRSRKEELIRTLRGGKK